MGAKALADAVTLIGGDQSIEYDSLRDPWMENETLFKNVPYGGGKYSLTSEPVHSAEEGKKSESHYGLADEERKISLNRAPKEVLSRLLRMKGGLSVNEADDLAVRIIDWRDTNNTQDGNPNASEDCSYSAEPAHCKDSDFEVLEELFWIPGVTVTLFDKIKGDVTLYGDRSCNINTASATSLMAAGLSDAGAQKIVAWREAGNVFENVSWISGRSAEMGLSPEDEAALHAAASAGFFGIRSDFYRGVVQAEFGGRVRGQVSFTVNRTGGIVSWRE